MSVRAKYATGFQLYRKQSSTDWGGDGTAFLRAIRGDLRLQPRRTEFRNNKMLEVATHTLFVSAREDIRLDDEIFYGGVRYRVVDLQLPFVNHSDDQRIFLELVR